MVILFGEERFKIRGLKVDVFDINKLEFMIILNTILELVLNYSIVPRTH